MLHDVGGPPPGSFNARRRVRLDRFHRSCGIAGRRDHSRDRRHHSCRGIRGVLRIRGGVVPVRASRDAGRGEADLSRRRFLPVRCPDPGRERRPVLERHVPVDKGVGVRGGKTGRYLGGGRGAGIQPGHVSHPPVREGGVTVP